MSAAVFLSHTWSNDDNFQDFWDGVQDDAGTQHLMSMSTAQNTILNFLGYISSQGNIRASSLQTYLSVINNLHADYGFTNPAQGQGFFKSARVSESSRATDQTPTKTTVSSLLHDGHPRVRPTRYNFITLRPCVCLSYITVRLVHTDRFRSLLLSEDVDICNDTFTSVSRQNTSSTLKPLHYQGSPAHYRIMTHTDSPTSPKQMTTPTPPDQR